MIMISNFKYRIYVLRKLAPFIKGKERFFWGKIICKATIFILLFLTPYFYGLYIEKVVMERQVKYLFIVITGYIISQVIISGCELFSNKCSYTINNSGSIALRLKILNKRFNQKMTSYDQIDSTNEKMLFDDAVFKLCDFSGVQSIDYFMNFFQVVGIAFLLLLLEWRLAGVLLISIPLTFWLNNRNANGAKKSNKQTWQNDREMGEHIRMSLNSWREIRASQMEGRSEDIFSEYSQKSSGLFRIYTRFWVTRRFLLPKLKDEFVTKFLVIFIGGLLIMNGSISVGLLLAFVQYYNQLSTSFQTIVSTDADLKINSVQYDKVFEVLDEKMVYESVSDYAFTNADICIKNVSFKYPSGEHNVFTNFSLLIKQGDRIAIVGESGSGKSTLLNLVVGALEPDSGEITFGGRRVNEVINSVHKKIGFVLQENMIFNTSIKENLLYVKPDATEAEIDEVCRKAHLTNFINSLPDGINTIVGERGMCLSGGERQRLVLARAFLRDVEVFVFDEATSALDQRTENVLQNAISEIPNDKTIIVVAHRESSLTLCDRRVYLTNHG